MDSVAVNVAQNEEHLPMRANRTAVVNVRESGFALILALLALLLLTFLGLTLAVTTSTELQIATNYRWSEQARYVAEAGAEAGKLMLRDLPDWSTVLPAPRNVGWVGAGVPTAAVGSTTQTNGALRIRDFENWNCDQKGAGMGNGIVLRTAGGVQQYVGTVEGQALPGVFTLWVRRPLHYLPDGTIVDWGAAVNLPSGPVTASNDNLVLVAEGMAPFTTAGALENSALVARNKAVYTVEISVSRTPSIIGSCQTSRTGQQGHGSDGANFGGCERLTADAMADALRGSTGNVLQGGDFGSSVR
jgi:hypothetical protein